MDLGVDRGYQRGRAQTQPFVFTIQIVKLTIMNLCQTNQVVMKFHSLYIQCVVNGRHPCLAQPPVQVLPQTSLTPKPDEQSCDLLC